MILSKVAEIRTGFHFRGTIEPDPEGEYRVLQVKDLDDSHHFEASQLTRVSPPGSNPEAYVVAPGDVLFLTRGPRQLALAVTDDVRGLLVPNHFFVLRPHRSVVRAEYLAWHLNHPDTQTIFRSLAQGSNVPYVAKVELARIDVPLPPLEVQDRIARLEALLQREQELITEYLHLRREIASTLSMSAARRRAPKAARR